MVNQLAICRAVLLITTVTVIAVIVILHASGYININIETRTKRLGSPTTREYASYSKGQDDNVLFTPTSKIIPEANGARAISLLSNDSGHALTWQDFYEVDGLRNEDVVVFVASTTVEGSRYLRDRIIPSARTWMKLLANVFVILEDTGDVRFQMRHCNIREAEHFTSFDCPHEPTYVLTRQCSSQYYQAEGICCKVDESINYLVRGRPELFAHTKFVLQCDDDIFWRTDQTLKWLATLDKANYSDLPLIGNMDKAPTAEQMRKPGGVWHIKGCEEIKSMGWYHPLILNHAAVQRISEATSKLGLMKTCRAFDVSQDAGIGVFAWIMELRHIHIPHVNVNVRHAGFEVLKPKDMVVHAVRHIPDEDCRAGKRWPERLRYDQQGDHDNAFPYFVSCGCNFTFEIKVWLMVLATVVMHALSQLC
jgi:hypothetical protein